MTEGGVQIAEVLDFPMPGSKSHTLLKLKVYRQDRGTNWHAGEIEVFDSAITLYDMGLIEITWEDGEPLFKITEAGSELGRQMGLDTDILVQSDE